jgi:putative transposase
MPRPALRLKVSSKDQAALKKMLAGGVEQVRVTMRAVALQRLAEGMGAPQISAVLPLSRQSVRNIARRYEQGGLERALYDKQRPGAASLLNAQQRQRIIAMVCSDPPKGRARWTVRLAAEEAVKRRLVPRAGRETIRVLLESHDLKPWREKNVVRGGSR